jgi:hypothetical protein
MVFTGSMYLAAGNPRLPLGDDKHEPGAAWTDSVPISQLK